VRLKRGQREYYFGGFYLEMEDDDGVGKREGMNELIQVC
jgi:hypothetical protein